jgi:hypothetical protein
MQLERKAKGIIAPLFLLTELELHILRVYLAQAKRYTLSHGMINGSVADSYWTIGYLKVKPATNFTTRGLKYLLIERKKFGDILVHYKYFGLAKK